MKKYWGLVMAICGCNGCTMLSLERHTVSQMDSSIDLRYVEVLDNLAMIAREPSTLPSYASIFSGTIFVQDQGQLVSTNIFPFKSIAQMASVSVNPSLNRQVAENWALDPVTSPEKLEAIRAACQWVIGGPTYVNPSSMSLLIRPDQAPVGPDRHFGVAERLSQLPPGWLCRGCLKDVPLGARYKAHSGDAWVWVMPDGMKGLTDFTLIIQDIARVSINSQTLFNFPPGYTPLLFETAESAAEPNAPIRARVQAYVDFSGRLVTETPFAPLRLDNLGSDTANLRSAIGAAGISSVH